MGQNRSVSWRFGFLFVIPAAAALVASQDPSMDPRGDMGENEQQKDGGMDEMSVRLDDGSSDFKGDFIFHPDVFYYILACTRCVRCQCIMHRCVISTMLVHVFGF